MSGLLAMEELPAAEILWPASKEGGSGGLQAFRWVILCDHASPTVPRRLQSLGLADKELNRHIGYDIGAAAVTRAVARRVGCPAVLCNYSRLVVDCNRAPNDLTAMPEVSDGTLIPGNQSLSNDQRQQRHDAIFAPYHQAIASVCQIEQAKAIAAGQSLALLALHSFTPCLRNGTPRPWHIGLLWNQDDRLLHPVFSALRRSQWQGQALCVGDNMPYSGKEIAYTLNRHAEEQGYPHLGIEIRQDLIAEAAGAELWAEMLAGVLEDVQRGAG